MWMALCKLFLFEVKLSFTKTKHGNNCIEMHKLWEVSLVVCAETVVFGVLTTVNRHCSS